MPFGLGWLQSQEELGSATEERLDARTQSAHLFIPRLPLSSDIHQALCQGPQMQKRTRKTPALKSVMISVASPAKEMVRA